MGRNYKKVPKANNQSSDGKVPRKDQSLDDDLLSRPSWHTSTIDLQGPWGWGEIDHAFFFNDILPKIQNYESMSWFDILNRNNHEVKVGLISKEAQKRLTELKLDDFETLVSLRLTGTQRIWGIKMQNVFKLLWWDPEHKVYPSKLKHT